MTDVVLLALYIICCKIKLLALVGKAVIAKISAQVEKKR